MLPPCDYGEYIKYIACRHTWISSSMPFKRSLPVKVAVAMEQVHTFLHVPNFRMWSTVSLLTGTERIHLVINGAHSTTCAWGLV